MLADQPNSISYATDGTTVSFAFPYYFFDPADLVVTYKDSTGAVVTKTLNSDYTVIGLKDVKLNTYKNGGTVKFGTALAPSGQVRITRRTPRSQPAVWNQNDPFPAGTQEASADRAIAIIQEALSALGVLGIADGPPTTGSFVTGNLLINANPTPGGTWGWIYIGGAWYELATISL